MVGFIASVDARTQLAGRNRMELLLFRLQGPQLFGINVFKVREVIPCPPLTRVPHCHPVVCGIINIRGNTMAVLDLAHAIGLKPLANPRDAFLVVTEYNGLVQGFLVESVDRIINHNWAEILPPPRGASNQHYLTAVTEVDKQLVEIVDVERVMAEVVGMNTEAEGFTPDMTDGQESRLVLIVDDSMVARGQVRKTLEQVGCEVVEARDGLEGLQMLQHWQEQRAPELARLSLIISDIEMPRMDGYTLTSKIRQTDGLKQFRVLLHTSLSGGFNAAIVARVGADEFIAKFDPRVLADAVLRHLNQRHEKHPGEVAASD